METSMSMSIRWRRFVVALTLAVAALGAVRVGAEPSAGSPAAAPAGVIMLAMQQAPAAAPEEAVPAQRENEIVRSPDTVTLPPSPESLLESNFPTLREGLSRLPPFFRDTDLNVRLRTFYFNRQNDDDTAIESWAVGGWVQYASGWLADTFALGATYYTSLPLYTPDDRPGSLLLTPDQDAIGTFGEAWGALRYKEYALLKGYRQRIDEAYVNPQDNRMVPNTFEAVTLSGNLDWLRYDVGYVWQIKPRDSNDFISMSQQAGAGGGDEGLVLGALTLTPIKDLTIYASTFYALEVYNTAFGKAEYTHTLGPDLKLQVGVQGTDQRSVGDERLGDFSTWNVGAGARLLWRGLSLGTAFQATGDEASIRSPWGSYPGYISLAVEDFNRANEKAFGFGLRYDFGGTLLPFQVPGLSVYLVYAQGNDREDPVTNSSLPTTREGNLDIIYNVPAVKGLSLRFRNAYVGRGNDDVVKDFRLIINYELNLL
jgi:outer membrane porin, OprD family